MPLGLTSLGDDADVPPELVARDAEPDHAGRRRGGSRGRSQKPLRLSEAEDGVQLQALFCFWILLLALPSYRRSLKLFASTDTDENDIAAAAIIGLSCQPVHG